MRALILFVFWTFCLTTNVHSQEIGFGLKGGLNLSTLSFSETHDRSSSGRTAFHVGVVAEIPITEKFSVQPELLYSAEGGKYVIGGSTSVPNNLEEKIDYLNLPVMAKYYLVDGFAVEAGPQLGYLVSGKTYEMFLVEGKGKINEKDAHHAFAFGLGAGISYEFPVGIFIATRYHIGLNEVYDNFRFRHYEDWKVKKNNFQLSLGYFF